MKPYFAGREMIQALPEVLPSVEKARRHRREKLYIALEEVTGQVPVLKAQLGAGTGSLVGSVP
jgi:hypothetical protein